MSKSKFLKFCYYVQTQPITQNFLAVLSWVFLALAVVEPPHKDSEEYFEHNPNNLAILVVLESFILFCFLIEMLMEIRHRAYYPHKRFWDKFIRNRKMLCKMIVVTCYLIDMILFYTHLPHLSFRFSRFLRPCKDGFLISILLGSLALY